MTAEHIIGIYVVIDETMRVLGHASHRLTGVSDAEVLTVAVVAAAFFGNHHARALARLRRLLRSQGREVLRLAASSGLPDRRPARRVHALAGRVARSHAGP